MSYNPFSLKDKTILITGASSGIGKATAIECSRMGANVIITGRDETRLKETFTFLTEGKHQFIVGDLTNDDNFEFIIENVSELDGIVHSAGISGHELFNFIKPNSLRNMMKINFEIPALLTQKLIKQKKVNKNSSIVFLNSTSGIISSYIGGSLYSASKGALNGLIKALALEFAPKKIRFNAVMPAMIETQIMNTGTIVEEQIKIDKQKYPLKRYGKPEEVAFAIIYLLSDASSWTTGTNLLLDGGRTISY
jgi:NAD(P)-dependent dehydrogenase (short-subunit alcohol dehydrogenase family)